jgi:hypothetical protein
MITRFLLRGLWLWIAGCVAVPTLGFGQGAVPEIRAGNPQPAVDGFVKIFDVLDSGFDWTGPEFGLMFVAIGLVIFAFPRIIRAAGIPYLNVQAGFQKFFRYAFLGFAILWTAIVFFGTCSAYLRHKALARDCPVVEGPVEHFIPMPYAGHASESFFVRGVPFRYSDFSITGGFNNTSSHGGPINGASYVRICYDPKGNVILRLEIRDFKGELKDYAKAQSVFAKPADVPNVRRSNIDVPWDSNFFLVLYILDVIAICTLYLPYLRTFFRVRTATVRDAAIPGALEPGRKIKLRNSMIYWETEARRVWLRPRGFNLIQIPLMVATLDTDAGGKLITGYQTRFSSGFPLVMAFFLWTAYRLFSATMPVDAKFLSPAQFIGVAAVFFLIAGFLNLRILRSRMDRLVEDALSEFKEMQNAQGGR